MTKTTTMKSHRTLMVCIMILISMVLFVSYDIIIEDEHFLLLYSRKNNNNNNTSILSSSVTTRKNTTIMIHNLSSSSTTTTKKKKNEDVSSSSSSLTSESKQHHNNKNNNNNNNNDTSTTTTSTNYTNITSGNNNNNNNDTNNMTSTITSSLQILNMTIEDVPIEPIPEPEERDDDSQQPNQTLLIQQQQQIQQSKQQRDVRNITLFVQLRGELGNQLSVLANAYITQLIAKQYYTHIHINIIALQQDYHNLPYGRKEKMIQSQFELITCFPNIKNTVEFINNDVKKKQYHDLEYKKIQQIQQSWLRTKKDQQKLYNVKSFHFLDHLLLLQQQQNEIKNTNTTSTTTSSIPFTNVSSIYSVPYLMATSFSWIECLKNTFYYHEIRKWMQFNVNECCTTNTNITNTANNHNNIIFHYRNYITELSKIKHQNQNTIVATSTATRYVEISPYIAASLAFQNITKYNRSLLRNTNNKNNNNKKNTNTNHTTLLLQSIGITSRYDIGIQQYINAFTKYNIPSYYMTGQQSGIDGFCSILLIHTQQSQQQQQQQSQLFGNYQSTYYRWAALLSNATYTRFYSIDTTSTTPVTTTTNNNNNTNHTTTTEEVLQSSSSSSSLSLSSFRILETIQHMNDHRIFTIEVYPQ